MAISFPIFFPFSHFSRMNIGYITSSSISRNPFTYDMQVQEYQGQTWTLEATLAPMTRAQAEAWQGFLLALKGQVGTFMLGDPFGKSPQGVAGGVPIIRGANQTGESLLTDGWTPATEDILKAGDFIALGPRLYKLKQDADSDAEGIATLEIFPRLRESPADDELIITEETQGIWRLSGNQVEVYAGGADRSYSISFQAVEAL